MSEARIGRVLVASLHQAIVDALPTRQEFYECWLNTAGLREGTVGLPAMAAVLSFLRREPAGAYEDVVRRAGLYAAEWTLATMPKGRRWAFRILPLPIRVRLANAAVRNLVRATYPSTRVIIKIQRGVTSIDIRGSLFCGGWHEETVRPRCGFYASAAEHLLRGLHVPAVAHLAACRGTGGERCVVESRFPQPGETAGTGIG